MGSHSLGVHLISLGRLEEEPMGTLEFIQIVIAQSRSWRPT